MILCLIILFVGIISLALGLFFVCKQGWDAPIWSIVTTVVGAICVFIAAILLITCPIESRKELNMFISQKEYIENYELTSEYDTAAIVSKKIELNEWLYSVQYTKKNYPICSFYGDEILELEPIK